MPLQNKTALSPDKRFIITTLVYGKTLIWPNLCSHAERSDIILIYFTCNKYDIN